MRDIKTSKVFVSVFKGWDAEQDSKNHAKAFDVLRREGVQFHVVRGGYKGRIEETFMLYTNNAEEHAAHLALGMDLARSFKQDAVLEIANDDTATLHRFAEGYSAKQVGTWKEVTKEEALRRDGYTCDPFSGRYFIVD